MTCRTCISSPLALAQLIERQGKEVQVEFPEPRSVMSTQQHPIPSSPSMHTFIVAAYSTLAASRLLILPNLKCHRRTLGMTSWISKPLVPLVSIPTNALILLLASKIQKEALNTQTSRSSLVARVSGSYNITHVIHLDNLRLVIRVRSQQRLEALIS